MISSGGTTQGITFCVAALGEQPAAIPAAPAMPRNVRRPMGRWVGSLIGGSLVTGPAVGEPLAPGLLPLHPVVAGEAPAHGERGRLPDRLHPLDLAVALLAADAGEDVRLVREADVVRDPVHPRPRDRAP